MTEGSRRFTDREVALVLKRAAELDDAEVEGAPSGLSLGDLTEIAGEVGISPAAIQKAVAGLDRRSPVGPALAGAPLVRRAVHAVPGTLDETAIARLIRLVDAEADAAGTVSEALGSVRWTASDRFMGTQVNFAPGGDQTSIEVMEKASPRLRRILHLVPAAWSLMLSGPVVGATALGSIETAGVAALAVVAGLGVGRAAWTIISRRSGRRVHRLAETLATAAIDDLQSVDRGESGP
jgi:hypothetical protein